LINIDDTKEKNKCLFCGTEVVTANALNLVKDTDARINLQKEAEKKAADIAQAKKDLQKQNRFPKTDAAPAAAAKGNLVVKPLPLKTKLIIFGMFFGFLAVLAGILVPTILLRNENRAFISAQMTEKVPFTIESYSFKFNDNREFLLATGEAVTEDEAKIVYNDYLSLYTQAYSVTSEKAGKKVIVKLYALNGLFECRTLDGVLNVVFSTATPTPTPTMAVSSVASSGASSTASAVASSK
jgi:hypothetical protein